jgi:plastocyanin
MRPTLKASAASAAVLILGATAAHAATVRQVTIQDFSFQPTATVAVAGDAVRWTNNGPSRHSTTSTISGAVGWDRELDRGTVFQKTVSGAGTYAYHCRFHSLMRGSVSLRVVVSPATGPVGTLLSVRLATVPAPTGFQYAPEVKTPGSTTWTRLARTTTASISYKATQAGTYAFRSSVRHGTLAGTAPSPITSVKIG